MYCLTDSNTCTPGLKGLIIIEYQYRLDFLSIFNSLTSRGSATGLQILLQYSPWLVLIFSSNALFLIEGIIGEEELRLVRINTFRGHR